MPAALMDVLCLSCYACHACRITAPQLCCSLFLTAPHLTFICCSPQQSLMRHLAHNRPKALLEVWAGVTCPPAPPGTPSIDGRPPLPPLLLPIAVSGLIPFHLSSVWERAVWLAGAPCWAEYPAGALNPRLRRTLSFFLSFFLPGWEEAASGS